jgi:hypothetical protein
MRNCVKCQAEICNRIKLDGKWFSLQNRKYCLTCSPFKKHNTRKHIDGNPKLGVKTSCDTCKKDFVYKHKAHTFTQCGNCNIRERRLVNKQKYVDYKGGCCERCGYRKCLGALDFHHKEPTEKDFGVSGPIRAWDIVKLELDKCLCLCANCHREVHDDLNKERYINP